MDNNFQNNNMNNGTQGYNQEQEPYVYQNNYSNGYQNGNGGFAGGIGSISGAFGEASEALKQKVVQQSFIFMLVGLVITAVGAKVASEVLLAWMVSNPVGIIALFIGELVIVFASNAALKANNAVLSAVLFTIYSFINGATLGIVCMAYVETSVTKVFVITAVMFGVTAFYGLVSKKDLSSIGGICFMGLIGLIIAGVVNIFLQSSGLDYLISGIGVLVFVGLTAYDTKKIKDSCAYADSSNVTALSLNGAFQLYLDFINLFLYLLRLFGKRR
jgi:hypothetical protein